MNESHGGTQAWKEGGPRTAHRLERDEDTDEGMEEKKDRTKL